MDPKVFGKLLTTHGEGDDDDVEALRGRSPLRRSSGTGPKMGSHGNRRYGGGIRVFSLLLMVSGYVDLYRRKEDTGEFTRAPRGRGRALGRGARPHPRGHLVAPLTWFSSLPCMIFSKNISPEGFIPFGLRLIFLNSPISFCSSALFIANLCCCGDLVLELACQIFLVPSSSNA